LGFNSHVARSRVFPLSIGINYCLGRSIGEWGWHFLKKRRGYINLVPPPSQDLLSNLSVGSVEVDGVSATELLSS